MIKLEAAGVWLQGPGWGRRVSWSRVLLLPLLLALALPLLMCLSMAHDTSWFHTTLSWLGYFHRKPTRENAVAAERIREVGWACLTRTQRAALDNLFRVQPPPTSSLPTLSLALSGESLQMLLKRAHRWDRNVMGRQHGQHDPYERALYRDETGELQKAYVSLRGTSPWHHRPEKPSFRVKIRRRDLGKGLGHRFTELQRPEDTLAFQAILSEKLAASMGVMASRSEPVRLFVNGQCRGVYLRTYRPSEELAVMQGRLPALFFKGDRFDRKTLWNEQLEAWSTTPEAAPEQRRLLVELTQVINGWAKNPRPEALDRLVDRDAYARYAAVILHAGSTHVDDCHNQVFYCSPYSGKLEPVIWDLNGYGMLEPADWEVNSTFHRLYELLVQDPAWLHSRNLALYRLVQGAGSAESVQKMLDEHLTRCGPDLLADRSLGELVRLYNNPDLPTALRQGLTYLPNTAADLETRRRELLLWVAMRDQVILDFLSQCRFSCQENQIVVYGTVGVVVRLPGQSDRLLYPGLGSPKRLTYTSIYPPAPRLYEVPGGLKGARFFNAVTGEPVQPEVLPPVRGKALPLPEVAPPPILTLGPGPVERDVVVGANEVVRILPGTVLRGSLLGRGKVEALGTPEQPISILGQVGLIGSGAFRQVRFSGPGAARWHEGARFAGQLSLYGSSVSLDRCEFSGRVTLARSHIEIRDCFWRGELSLAQCQGGFERCSFQDGLALEQSRVSLKACVLQGAGLRAAELSQVDCADSRFLDCRTGVLARDRSRASLVSCAFLRNGIAADAHRKKPFYRQGGELSLRDCKLEANVHDLRVDEHSRITLHGTRARAPFLYPERIAGQGR